MGNVYASLRSIASFVPQKCVSNAEFEKTLDTSDEWISKRTGIKTRYFALDSQNTSDLAYEAGKLAISRAGLTPNDIELVIVATLSPDFITMPSTACLLSAKLGIENVPAFDISAACSGFVYLLKVAKSFIESKAHKNVLIVGAEKISSLLDFSDRSTCVLFGDGAGAAVISAEEDKNKSIIDVHISANGKYGDFLFTPRVQNGQDSTKIKQCLQMKGNETFKLAVKTLANDVRKILQNNKLNAKDITYFVPHQANLRILQAVGNMLDFEENQIVVTVNKFGNTSAASIPMALDELHTQKKLKNGDLLLLDAFGGGMTWGSALLYYNG